MYVCIERERERERGRDRERERERERGREREVYEIKDIYTYIYKRMPSRRK
jgi:hypothetical protein